MKTERKTWSAGRCIASQAACCRLLAAKLVLHCSLLVTFLLFTVHYSLFTGVAFASQADSEVLRIQKAYQNIKDIKGNFLQKSHIKDLKRTDSYKGNFFIKAGNMKWQYSGKEPQTVYITGEDIIIYLANEKQAFKARFDRATYGQAPIALLGGFGNIKKEFDVSLKSENKLILKPKTELGNISQIELSLSSDGFPIKSLEIIDSLSNKIEIFLSDVKINSGLADKIFKFSPPEGVNVISQ